MGGPVRVVVAGGGVAALEAVMALRTDVGAHVAITLLAPDPDFHYRPLSVEEPFAMGKLQALPLSRIAGDFDCELRQDELAWVAPEGRKAFTASGDELEYDYLVVCLGARYEPAFEHVLTFCGQEDSEAVHGLIQDVEGGYAKRIAFIAPGGNAWTLPLYELALMTARRAWEMNMDDLEIVVVTPEERPLAVFGGTASDEVAHLLEDAGIVVEASTYPHVETAGVVQLGGDERRLECDRIVALPRVIGPTLRGLPSDSEGFIPINRYAAVEGVEHVYAAGDATNFPIKQGGLACQQADAVARSISRAIAALEPEPFRPILRGVLLTGDGARYLRADVRGGHGDTSVASQRVLWWPPSKVAGRYLAPYLAQAHTGAWHGQPEAVDSLLAAHPGEGETGTRRIEQELPADPEHFEMLRWPRPAR